jgi:uncharacterized membrane protein
MRELRAGFDHLQEFWEQGPIAVQQVLDLKITQAGFVDQQRPCIPKRVIPIGAQQRHILGAGCGHLLIQVSDRRIDGILGHHPIGRVLATLRSSPDHGPGRRRHALEKAFDVESDSPASRGRRPA